ncbi:MAG: bifunctional phosphoribosylaminoimidazolecarboxamide formyltransferase/IMP cyclohydrolase [Armatimonadetes bacterium]|nr:bifunctional phosphoribosylaminoimidazolecarboxamide formyltransferase/IMP cyclohydrolase [Armatimonadota bacterium]MDE2205578.1 bifunctional phosphoribosylaminoimidazolecarboxamide formyltransferase/IMP cyclohydrolase [Armatimonadota bacterium]
MPSGPETDQNRRVALLSVSDKRGLPEFAAALTECGYEIVSTGGTAKTLMEHGIAVTQVQDLTGFPEMLDGRVKTLHPVIHGGLLAVRDDAAHVDALAAHGIRTIDLVCVNLYPFEATVDRSDVTLAEAIENIDIGGPAMIRSAAKNSRYVTVVVSPDDYKIVEHEIYENGGTTTAHTRQELSVRAFEHTARYDAAISTWLRRNGVPADSGWPRELSLGLQLAQACRYGENPHQRAAFYRVGGVTEPCIANAVQLHGKELSFNNLYDLNGALETAKELADCERPAAVIIKHANPCGAAVADSLAEAFRQARSGDTISAFGGILALTHVVDEETALEITGPNNFFEAVIAPGYHTAALRALQERKKWSAGLRILECGTLAGWREAAVRTGFDMKRVTGGMLVQEPDHIQLTESDLTVASSRRPTADEVRDLLFAWRMVRHVKSNAIVLAAGEAVIGVGAGQMNRVNSVRLALQQAGERAAGAVLASDAFFPFPDGPQAAADAGVSAIVQPGGSVKDSQTIEVVNRHNMAMVFTAVRHFLH